MYIYIIYYIYIYIYIQRILNPKGLTNLPAAHTILMLSTLSPRYLGDCFPTLGCRCLRLPFRNNEDQVIRDPSYVRNRKLKRTYGTKKSGRMRDPN